MRSISLIFVGLVLAACSGSDDDNSSGSGNYYPAAEGNYWTYEVQGNVSGRDSIYSNGTQQIEGNSYDAFAARVPIYGVYTTLLTQAGLRSEGGRIYVSGTFTPIASFPIPFEVDLDDVLILDTSKGSGSLLASETRVLEIPYGEYTITLDLEIRSEMVEQNGTMTAGDNQFNEVSSSALIISGTGAVTASLDGVPVTIPVLGQQEMLRMELSFAKDVGLIYAETNINLELSNTAVAQLDIPESYSETNLQELDDYLIDSP